MVQNCVLYAGLKAAGIGYKWRNCLLWRCYPGRERGGKTMGTLYGYIRVSTREQNGDRQILALKELFIPEKNLFMDTRRGKDLMGTSLSDIVLQVLSFVAENERINIRQRQAEGIAAAKARGIRFGRPPAPLPENFHHLYHQWKNGKITGKTAAKLCGMPLSTFRYRAAIYEKNNFL